MTYDPTSPNGAAGGSSFSGGGYRGPASNGQSAGQTSGFRGALNSGSSAVGGAKDQLLGGFSRVVDSLEGQIHRAPADLQPGLKGAAKLARERPLATMAGLAVIGLMLARGGGRR